MEINLSNCKATKGSRLIYYYDKFSTKPWNSLKGNMNDYKPCIDQKPELNTEYVLNDYFKEGDPYEARATICFLESLNDGPSVKRFDASALRTFKAADE